MEWFNDLQHVAKVCKDFDFDCTFSRDTGCLTVMHHNIKATFSTQGEPSIHIEGGLSIDSINLLYAAFEAAKVSFTGAPLDVSGLLETDLPEGWVRSKLGCDPSYLEFRKGQHFAGLGYWSPNVLQDVLKRLSKLEDERSLFETLRDRLSTYFAKTQDGA